MGSVSEVLTVVPLHQRPDLLESCADLINEEWKRSRTSRIHSLQKSAENFPMCLVLIRTPRTAEEAAEGELAKSQCQLLGHARLSRVVGQPKSLFVETVVVSKAIRGKGYGRKLMEAVESYAKSRGYSRLHLTTHDKQHFYAHLGYRLSEPVQSAGFMSSLIPMEFLEIFSPPQHGREFPAAGSGTNNAGASNGNRAGANLPPLPPSAPSLPSSFLCSVDPPPARPPVHPASAPNPAAVTNSSPPTLSASSLGSFSQPINAAVQPSQSPSVPLPANPFSATGLPSPPPPPPPPPPLSPPGTQFPGLLNSCKNAASCPPQDKSQGQTLLETPYRDLRGQPVFWMEKDI